MSPNTTVEWFWHPATEQYHMHPNGARAYRIAGYPGYALITTGFFRAPYYDALPFLQLPEPDPEPNQPNTQEASTSSSWLGPAPPEGELAARQELPAEAQNGSSVM